MIFAGEGAITTGTDAGTTYYLNDPTSGAMEERFSPAGSSIPTWRDYIIADGHMVALRTDPPSTNPPLWGGTTIWGGFSWTAGTAVPSVSYFTSDNLGSLTVITDESGAIAESDSYDAWGKRRNLDGSADPACALTSSITTRGFTAQQMMDPVCLINFNARIYDQTLGRFLSADSVVQDEFNLQALNRYSYVNNGPLSFTDPTGNFSVFVNITPGGDTGKDRDRALETSRDTSPGFQDNAVLSSATQDETASGHGEAAAKITESSGNGTGATANASPTGSISTPNSSSAVDTTTPRDGQSNLAALLKQLNAQGPASGFNDAPASAPSNNGSAGNGTNDDMRLAQISPGGDPLAGMSISQANGLYDAGYSVEQIGAILSGQQFIQVNALLFFVPGGDAEATITVYRALSEEGNVIYVGITNSIVRRASEQLAERGIEIRPIPRLSGLTRRDARAVEQALIEIHGLGKNGGTLLNRINSIAKSNPIYASSLARGQEILTRAKYLGD